MVCIYCGADTQVANSRPQKRANNIWRRRRCVDCGASFTTHETPDLAAGLLVRLPDGSVSPFYRDKLFVSILNVCDQLPDPYPAATALTATTVASLLKQAAGAEMATGEIARTTALILKRFQPLLAVRYASLHSESFDAKKLARGLL